MKRIALVVLALALSACITPLAKTPTLYGCEGLSDYGCPDQPPEGDDTGL